MNVAMLGLVGLLLTAGAGTRFGGDKLLFRFADMPFIASSSYLAVASSLRGGATLAAPHYQGSPA